MNGWKRWSTVNCARDWILKILPYGKMHKLKSVQENETQIILWDFEIQMDHLIPALRPDLVLIKKNQDLPSHRFSCSNGPQIKMKEIKKIDKYLDLVRELKKQWDMSVTVIPMVVGALGLVSKGLEGRLVELEIKGRVKTILTTALSRMPRILTSPGDLLSLRIQWKTTSQHWCEKYSRSEIIIMMKD